ncbi:hypothetical protein EYF80_058411 [Liparis tanakae]|uniref:Carboxylesterase type B domain-containing protein n=1 Tax=Liparis tanakae TaxID=230148 RepID=A0A4Z2ERA2_9TELE|nr:hypothetical protein EYF80_058411 [Liparis tanakae]
MASPLATGLFHAAVDMSGSSVLNASLQRAESANRVFLQKTGCGDRVCLRRLSVTQVLQAVPWQEFPFWAAEDLTDLPTRGRFVGPVAVVDGHVLEAPPLELRSFSRSLPEEALRLYPSSAPCPTPDRCPERAYTTMGSDIRLTCPSNHLARSAAAALRSPVYRYLVTHTPSGPVGVASGLLPFAGRFSFRGLDAVAFFGGMESVLGKTPSDRDRSFQELLTRHLVGFARTGKMAAEWPEYPEATALLSDRLALVQNYSSARCRLWKENGLDAYAWTS